MSDSTSSSPEPVQPPVSVELTSEQCANCGLDLAGRYCADCGQRTDVRTLSIRGLLTRFFGELTSFERPMLRTMLGALLRPGVVAREYVDGQRTRYTNLPVG